MGKNNETDFRMMIRGELAKLTQLAQEHGIETESFSLSFANDRNTRKKWKPQSHFAKIYNNELVSMIKNYKLDSYELSSVLLLLPYVEYETNLISKDGTALIKKDIVKLLGYSENKTDEILKSLVSKKVLAKTKVGRMTIYHMNPHLAFRGNYLSPETESIFRNLE